MRKALHIFIFVIQYCFYYFITPLAYVIYGRKRAWIICERGDDARDNGFAFFKYLNNEKISFINSYYLIKKDSPDFKKVIALGNVIKYKSFKHWLLYRVAECKLSTHLSSFAPGNFIGEWFKHHKHKSIDVFLQHGVNHNDYPSNHYKYNGCDLFICGAKPEYDFLKKNGGYPEGNIAYTGLSRFDYLHDKKTKRQILVMPTWRNYLHNSSIDNFKVSEYFKRYDSLLRNNYLNQFLEENDISLIFYVHYSLQHYTKCFKKYGKNIIVADFNNFDVQSLLIESKLLITDYSSIFFDFAYMKKPIIYYQFDEEDFYSKHLNHGYFSHKRDGFGKVIQNEDDLINCIVTIVKNNYIVDKEYLIRRNKYFVLDDTNNSKRIFNAIIEKVAFKKKYSKNNKPTYLLVCGDDYGRNDQSTIGINDAYNRKFIQQASLMVNRSHEDMHSIGVVPKECIAYHFNITEGYQSFGDTTFYAYSVNKSSIAKRIMNKRSFIKIDDTDKKIIYKELVSQIEKFKSLGYECLAFDSHGHIHNRLPIARLIIPKCKEFGFKVARIPMNIQNKHLIFSLTYKKFIIHLYRKHFITTDYFCSCYDLIHLNLNKYHNKVIEIMTHPFISDNELTNRRDIEFETILKYVNQFNVRFINYNKLIEMRNNKNGKNEG